MVLPFLATFGHQFTWRRVLSDRLSDPEKGEHKMSAKQGNDYVRTNTAPVGPSFTSAAMFDAPRPQVNNDLLLV